MSVKQSELNAMTAAQLDALIMKAEMRREELRKTKIGILLEEIRSTLSKEGLEIADLFPTHQRAGKGGKKKKGDVKYRDPKESKNVWSGRGKRPHWLRDAIAAGKKLESFLV